MNEQWDLSQATWQLPTKSVTDTNEDAARRSSRSSRRTTECYELTDKYLYRRAYSESKLLDAIGLDDLKPGHSYHVLTGGNVDSLSFLKVILMRHRLDYLLFSTWCMAAEDILQIEHWMRDGHLNKLDAYVGEIFPNQYKIEWQMLNRLFAEYQCGRLVSFNNHAKIFVGWGGDFYFAIESSANINTNPRQEQTVITIDKGLALFYKDCYDKIKNNE